MSDDLAAPSILWRRTDSPGHDSARLLRDGDGWRLIGTAVFAHEQSACRLDYTVMCRSDWSTSFASVSGWIGTRTVNVEISADHQRNWRLDGRQIRSVAGCIDVDLSFSPSTNLLPIRRLDLAVGDEATVKAAWLRFPSFELEPLEQRYKRIDRETYRYESSVGDFAAELTVNAVGFVTRYADLWHVEPAD